MDKATVIYYLILVLTIFKNLLVYAIIVKIIMSWFMMGQHLAPGRFARFIDGVADPVINLARFLPHKVGMMDLAPLIAMFGLDIFGELVISLLYRLI